MITLRLPTPPSTNNLYFNRGKRRVPTTEFKDWMDDAALHIISQRVGSIKGPVTLEFAVEENKRRDLGNYEKIVTDALVRYGVIEGDRCKTVRGICLRWSSAVKGVQVSIESAV